MTKRRDLVRELKRAGFKEDGGTGHARFIHPDGRCTFVPRHSEIGDHLAQAIRKQAGLR